MTGAESGKTDGIPRYQPTVMSQRRRTEGFGGGIGCAFPPALLLVWVSLLRIGVSFGVSTLLATLAGIAIGAVVYRRRERGRIDRTEAADGDLVCEGAALVSHGAPVFVPYSDPYPDAGPVPGVVVFDSEEMRLRPREHPDTEISLPLAGLSAQVLPPKRGGAVGVILSNASNDVSWWWVRVGSERVREALHRARVPPHLPDAPTPD